MKTTIVIGEKDPKWALGLFVALSADPQQNEEIEADLEQADASFPGVLIWKFGNRWLSIDALDATTAAAVLPDEVKDELGIPN